MKESLFFIVIKHTDELIIDRAFDSKAKAETYIDNSMLSREKVHVKEAVYTIKGKK